MQQLINFWKINKVLIVGLFAAIATAGYEVLSKGDNFSWWVIGWSCFIAGLSWAGKNLRGQWMSIASTLATTTYAFYILHNSPTGLTMQMVVHDLLLPTFIQLASVVSLGPPKSREYEHSEVIVTAKQEAKTIAEVKKIDPESPLNVVS